MEFVGYFELNMLVSCCLTNKKKKRNFLIFHTTLHFFHCSVCEYGGFEGTYTRNIFKECVISVFFKNYNSHSHVRNHQVEIHIFIQELGKNKSNEVIVTAEGWRTSVNSKHGSHARTGSYSRLYRMTCIDLCNTFREQWIALLQPLLRAHVEVHEVPNLLWTLQELKLH